MHVVALEDWEDRGVLALDIAEVQVPGSVEAQVMDEGVTLLIEGTGAVILLVVAGARHQYIAVKCLLMLMDTAAAGAEATCPL